MRHRIFGRLRSPRPPDHVVHFGDLAQQILDAMVEAVDLLERRLRRQNGLQQQRAFVELRHEVRADPGRHEQRRKRNGGGQPEDEQTMAQTEVEDRRVGGLHVPNQPDVLMGAWLRSAEDKSTDHGNQTQGENQRRRDRRHHRGRERLIHSAFDS